MKIGNKFLGMTPKAQATKAKTKWDYIKLKSFYTSNETINKMKNQPTGWEKISANHISVKRLLSKMYKEFIQLNSKNKSDLKGTEKLNKHFFKEDI